jgi:hypothetical protein
MKIGCISRFFLAASFLQLSFFGKGQLKPNVLFIQLDDFNGFSASNYYPAVKMPHLEKLNNIKIYK